MKQFYFGVKQSYCRFGMVEADSVEEAIDFIEQNSAPHITSTVKDSEDIELLVEIHAGRPTLQIWPA